MDQPEPDSDLGNTLEGGAEFIGTLLTAGGLEALPGDDEESDDEILKKSWKTAVKKAGIRYLRFHDLRHTFNTRLMEAGVTQDVRKALMGHSDGDINATYTHVELPMKRQAIRQLDAWVAKQRKVLRDQQRRKKEDKQHGNVESEEPEGNDGSEQGEA